jgi:predicted HicB family RNase H-like nuclease
MRRTTDPDERRINLKVDPSTHRRLRLLAVQTGTTLQAMITGWIEEQVGKAEKRAESGAKSASSAADEKE